MASTTMISERARQILENALALSPAERAAVAEGLLSSVYPVDPRIDALVLKEARARIAAYEAGEMEALSAEEFFEESDPS